MSMSIMANEVPSSYFSPVKGVSKSDFKGFEDPASTDTGDDTVSQDPSLSVDDATSSEDESQSQSCEDSSFLVYSVSEDSSFLVYSTAILLQLRAAVGRCSPAPFKYGTQPRPRAEPEECQWRTRAAPFAAAPKKEQREVPVRAGPPAALAPRNGSDDEKFTRSIRSILNKLTVEKFDSLYEQLATCGVQTPGHITILMRDIFEKATAQHHFISMYADLCVRLEADTRITQAAESEGEFNSFRRLLLGQCQAAFEQLLEPPTCKSDEEACILRKKRALGNVKLVGQIMVRGMLSPKLLCRLAEELLNGNEECAEALESLAAFLTVVGSTFDVPSFPHRPKLEAIFGRVRELIADKKVPSRTRFLLRDVMDLRQAGWPGQARATMQPAGPMKLDEVASLKAVEEQAGRACPTSPAKGPWRGDKEKTHKANEWRSDRTNQKSEKSRNDKAKMEKDKGGRGTTARSHNAKGNTEKCVAHVDRSHNEKVTKVCQKQEMESTKEVMMPPRVRTTAEVKVAPADGVYDTAAFHHALAGAMRDLASDRDVAGAVSKVCVWDVPVDDQAKEFADILSRAVEEKKGPARRSAFAFAAALVGKPGAFLQKECAAGTVIFFQEVFEQLCTEVPQLDAIVLFELMPMLRTVIAEADLQACVPEDLCLA